MIKAAVIGVMAVFLALLLKKEKEEISMLLALTACLLLLSLSLGKLQTVVDAVKQVQAYLGSSAPYVGILLKMIGITYVAEFGAGICSDAGYQAVARQIEFYGKLMILTVSIPIFTTLLETIAGI